MRRFVTCCGVQLCGGASTPRLVVVLCSFCVFVSASHPSAFASIKEILVLGRVRQGGSAVIGIPALVKGGTVLLVCGCASVAPGSRAVPWSTRSVSCFVTLCVMCRVPVTGRASDGRACFWLPRGSSVTPDARVPGSFLCASRLQVTGRVRKFRAVFAASPLSVSHLPVTGRASAWAPPLRVTGRASAWAPPLRVTGRASAWALASAWAPTVDIVTGRASARPPTG